MEKNVELRIKINMLTRKNEELEQKNSGLENDIKKLKNKIKMSTTSIDRNNDSVPEDRVPEDSLNSLMKRYPEPEPPRIAIGGSRKSKRNRKARSRRSKRVA